MYTVAGLKPIAFAAQRFIHFKKKTKEVITLYYDLCIKVSHKLPTVFKERRSEVQQGQIDHMEVARFDHKPDNIVLSFLFDVLSSSILALKPLVKVSI